MCNSHYTIILIVWWLLFIIRCVSDNTNLRLNCIALGLFTVFICIDCVFQVQTELSRLSYDDVDTFNEYYESTDKAIQQVKAKDDGFYRLEKTFLHGNGEQIYNDSYLFNYNGISCFSSTTKDELKSFMGRLGYRRNFLKIVYDGGSTEFVDSLLGIRYVLEKDDNTGNISVNEDQLAMGIVTDDMSADEHGSNSLSFGSDISQDGNGILLTIPYDKNWVCYVDGQKQQIQSVYGGFSVIVLNKGQHKVELKYPVKGLKTGILISLVSVLVLIAIGRKGLKNKQSDKGGG